MAKGQKEKLSIQEAYKVMFLFLDFYWKLGNRNSNELGALLSSLALLPDGSSADPALLHDWRKCVDEVISYRDKSEIKPWEFNLKNRS